MNILCPGGRVVGESLAVDLARAFLAARFVGAARHGRRLAAIARLEGGGPP